MKKLVCDVCGGELEMQAGGEKGQCTSCGLTYSLDRMKEIYAGMKVSITGTKEDVEQWKTLLATYLKVGDYSAAEETVHKILGAKPNDTYANEIYLNLQDWKHFEIKNGVLVKYNGVATDINIPQCVSEIGAGAFVKAPYMGCEIKHVTIPESVIRINQCAFAYCKKLEEIHFSKGLEYIGVESFSCCETLTKIVLPDTLIEIDADAFKGCSKLSEITIPDSLQRISDPFCQCPNVRSVKASQRVMNLLGSALRGTEQSKLWSSAGLCEYCGNKLDSMFTCVECKHTNEAAFLTLCNMALNFLCKARDKFKIYSLLMQRFNRSTRLDGLKQKGFAFGIAYNDIYIYYKGKGAMGWHDYSKPLYLNSSNIVDAIDFIKRNI